MKFIVINISRFVYFKIEIMVNIVRIENCGIEMKVWGSLS